MVGVSVLLRSLSVSASTFPTYLWHYIVARLIYDHLVVVLVAGVLAALLLTRRRR